MAILSSQTLILTHTLTLLTLSTYLLTSPSSLTSASLVWLLGESMHIRPSATGLGGFEVPSEALAALALVLVVLAITEGVQAGGLDAAASGVGAGQVEKGKGKGGEKGQGGAGGRAGGRWGDAAGAGAEGMFGEAVAIQYAAQGQWTVVATLKSLLFGAVVLGSYLVSVSGAGKVENLESSASMAATASLADSAGGISTGGSGAGGSGGLLGGGIDALNNRVVFVGAFVEMLFWGFVWRTLKDERRGLLGRVRDWREQQGEGEIAE